MTKSEERRTHEDREIQSSSTTTESTQGNNKHALILYVVGIDPTIAAIERYNAAQWNYIAKPKMDISQKLPADIKVEDPNGREFNQKVCLIIGYKCSAKGEEHKQKAGKRKTEWQQKRGEQQGEPSKTSENSGLVEIEEEVVSPRQERVNLHEGQGIRNVQEENVEKWEETRGKSTTKGQRQHMGMAKISIANDFGPLHDHDTRRVADMGKGFGGAVKVECKGINAKFSFTTIYGLHTIVDRRSLWEQLRRIYNNQQTPWVAMGDYNIIHRGEDRMVGSPVTDAEIKDFDYYLRDASMTILKDIGRDFTWTNGHTYSRIDWALVNTRWMVTMPSMEVQILDHGCSNHSPLSINFVQ
ncbi:hypothetical protein R3W88_033601 [Solanum pinnatisectum]|uniref:Endonuclease/exonuclease/phosphatase domain-containing protein n=1 Tax=Solanum pinnatisectum TaxID=50273 RepID=A0AAV9K135_9SOLN|nr:hypothetical protein R3W88_033601 [Solanum pinnatisectum]